MQKAIFKWEPLDFVSLLVFIVIIIILRDM